MNLEKYIKRYTGKDIKVIFVKDFTEEPECGAKYFVKRNLLKIREDCSDSRPLIWHEMGHIATTPSSKFCVKHEVDAQLWVMKTLKKLKYKKLYKESLEYIKSWNIDRDAWWRLDIYGKAKNIILKKIK